MHAISEFEDVHDETLHLGERAVFVARRAGCKVRTSTLRAENRREVFVLFRLNLQTRLDEIMLLVRLSLTWLDTATHPASEAICATILV